MAEALLGTPVEILEPEPEAPKEKRKRSTAYLAQRTVRREDALKLRQERDTVLYDPGKGSIWLGQALEHYKVHGLVFLGGVISTTEQWHLLKVVLLTLAHTDNSFYYGFHITIPHSFHTHRRCNGPLLMYLQRNSSL
jgi:hypothetical protein